MANPYIIKIELPTETKRNAMAITETGSMGGNNSLENFEFPSATKMEAKNLVSFSIIQSTADNIISHKISQISLETGATEYEQRLATVHSIASQVVGAGASLVSGAASGPAGLALAAIGVVFSGINKLISIKQKSETLQKQQWLEEITIGMQNARAGTTGRRGKNQ